MALRKSYCFCGERANLALQLSKPYQLFHSLPNTSFLIIILGKEWNLPWIDSYKYDILENVVCFIIGNHQSWWHITGLFLG